MDLGALYAQRFGAADLAWKARVFEVLWRRVFAAWVPAGATLVDLGAGSCEFINAARAARRIAVDVSEHARAHAAPGVEVRVAPADRLDFLGAGEVDVVFTSNFFEHLASKDGLFAVLREVHRVLAPGGLLIAVGPNARLMPGAYWDFVDHELPLTDRSLAEALRLNGFRVERSWARFLPASLRAVPRLHWAWLVEAYLALRPLSARLLGKQFLLLARKAPPR